jgi:hypothetical protein
MTETITEKVERLRLKAELFIKENTSTFIKTYSGDYYFGKIIASGENRLTFYSTRGRRNGQKDFLLFLDIDSIEEDEGERK